MAEPVLSEYERLREDNIARNRRVMLELGLIDDDVALHKRNVPKKKKATKKREPPAAPREGGRRSKRVKGQDPEGCARAPAGDGDDGDRDDDGIDGAHATARAEHEARWAGRQQRSTIIGTASYAHTLMRVRTMSETALFRRKKTIETAKGQHAVTKMRLFARVCYLEELFELAGECTAALARLVGELGDPENDETVDVDVADA